MRHAKKRNSLGRPADQQRALMRTLAKELFTYGGIRTTLSKAKVLRPFVEKIITKAIKASQATDPAQQLHYKRMIVRDVYPKELNNIMSRSAKLVGRKGGYTRILKTGARAGDNTEMALIQMLDQ